MPLPPDLSAGIAGVAWAAEHLYGPHFATDATDSDPDDLAAETWRDEAGLLEGVTGIGLALLGGLGTGLGAVARLADRLEVRQEAGGKQIIATFSRRPARVA